jgi:hypothetical protein
LRRENHGYFRLWTLRQPSPLATESGHSFRTSHGRRSTCSPLAGKDDNAREDHRHRHQHPTEIFGSVQSVADRTAPLDPLTYGAVNYNLHASGAIGRFFTIGAGYTFS